MPRAAAATLLLLIAALGCRTSPSEFRALPADDPRPARLLAAWQETAATRVGLRGRTRLSVDAFAGDAKLRARQVVAVERPERLRIEIKALFDQTVAVLVTDAGEFELLRADDHSYRRGAIEPGLLWETAWIDVAPEQAIELLVAAPTLGDAASLLAARVDGVGGVEIDLADAEGRLLTRVWFDAEGELRAVDHFRISGERAWRAEYDDYQAVGDDVFPHRLRLLTAEETSAELVFSDVELNPVLSPTLFRLRR